MAAVLRACPIVFAAKSNVTIGAKARGSSNAKRVVPRRGPMQSPLIVKPARRGCAVVPNAGPSPCDLSDLSKLPGDPSLVIHTNVKMGDKKKEFMAAASKAVAQCLQKPENFVVVAVLDEQDMIWGGDDSPCALCNVSSLGSINYENNTALSGAITALMSDFEVLPSRMYTNFWDIGPRENCGYNGVTFAEGARPVEAVEEEEEEAEEEAEAEAEEEEVVEEEPEEEEEEEVVEEEEEEAVEEEPEAEEEPEKEEEAREEPEEEEEEPTPEPPTSKAKKQAEDEATAKNPKIVAAKLKRMSDEKVLKLWRKKCPELRELWPLDETVDTWEGITFDEDGLKGKVVSIELDDIGITGELPMEIGGFTSLTVLALDGNEITSVPSSIGMLKDLEECYLSNNLLKSVPPELGDCDNLETLWLNNNRLKKIPKELGNLAALQTLDVSENELTTLPKQLAECELLEQLDIYNNPFKKLPEEFDEEGLMEAQGCNVVREPIN